MQRGAALRIALLQLMVPWKIVDDKRAPLPHRLAPNARFAKKADRLLQILPKLLLRIFPLPNGQDKQNDHGQLQRSENIG